ncbi:hypothetical protein [Paenibacillus odorifer]|uniref:hypothetical protein n=1 Tax=Paenibacillus odorifer TaxID=189426 RepID=UPI00096E3259|nr:hypothetical protein [Paenibacillus odorifer]OME27735.1 hypothetical protein BSK57_03730 [Paenibacillus odorifer]
MWNFLIVILFFLFIYLMLSIIKPSFFLKFTKKNLSRGKTSLFAVGALVLLIAVTAASPTTESSEEDDSTPVVAQAQTKEETVAAEAKAKNEAEDKAQKEAEKKAKEEAEKKAKEEAAAKKKAEKEEKAKAEAEAQLAKLKNPDWNTAELDAMENGNFLLTIDMLKAIEGEPVTPVQAKSGTVFKTPWEFYGKPVEFTVYVAIVQDYPPDSDNGKVGILSEIVGTTEDGTIIDVFGLVSSGDIAVNDEITLVAYPVGHVTVENKLGGQTDQLAVVANKF